MNSSVVDQLGVLVEQLSEEPVGLMTGAELCDHIAAVEQIHDRLDGRLAELFKRAQETSAYEEDGASTITMWARQRLRLSAPEARSRVKAGQTLAQLPQAAAAVRDGRIRQAHVHELTAGITKAGAALIAEAEPLLMPVATSNDPRALREAIAKLVDVVYPDQLDEAWVRGMDKRDLKVTKAGDGFHVSGFLDVLTGARFKTWIDAAAAPRGDDSRTPSQRRVDAVGELVTAALDHGLPTDRGVRPQVHVVCELETLTGAAATPAAELTGFGTIGRDLLGYLACTGDVTGILVDGRTAGPTPQAAVLNVGRTRRLATTKQRHAVQLRQDGTCAAPGCTHTHLEIHHAKWWDRDDGATDLDNLVGLCSRCHHLVHAAKLHLAADGSGGFAFRRPTGIRVDDHARVTRQVVRRRLRALSSSTPSPSRAGLPARPRVQPRVTSRTRTRPTPFRAAARAHAGRSPTYPLTCSPTYVRSRCEDTLERLLREQTPTTGT